MSGSFTFSILSLSGAAEGKKLGFVETFLG
jgi:hypothetical protein